MIERKELTSEVKMNKLTMSVTLIFIFLVIIAWIFYFYGLKYVKKKNFWLYTGIGPIILKQNIERVPEPGRTYIRVSLYVFEVSVISFVLFLVLLRLMNRL